MALLSSKRYGKNQFQIYNGQSVLPSFVFYRNVDWLLDEFADSVFVTALDTYEVLYMNKNACELLNVEKRKCMGRKCYEVFHNEKEPCWHCPKKTELSSEKFLETPLVLNGQSYITRSKIISWSGVPARVQYITHELPGFLKPIVESDDNTRPEE